MMLGGLTPKQARLLAFLREWNWDRGVSPSFQNIMDGVGIKSKSNIHRFLAELEDRGFITTLRHPNGKRRAHGIKLKEAA